MNLGAILHLNGKLQEAEANYLRALQLKPDDAITQSNLRKLWNIMEKQGLKTMAPWLRIALTIELGWSLKWDVLAGKEALETSPHWMLNVMWAPKNALDICSASSTGVLKCPTDTYLKCHGKLSFFLASWHFNSLEGQYLSQGCLKFPRASALRAQYIPRS